MARRYGNKQHLLLTRRENGRVRTLIDAMVPRAVHRRVMRFIGSKAELTQADLIHIEGIIAKG